MSFVDDETYEYIPDWWYTWDEENETAEEAFERYYADDEDTKR